MAGSIRSGGLQAPTTITPGNGDLPAYIGKYRVLRRLGEGATSDVYLAQDDFQGIEVATKRVRSWALSSRSGPEGQIGHRFFAAEAAGLRWLAVPGGVPVVGVHDVSRTRLVIDRVETGPATAQDAEKFGRQLVRTHDAGASCFGVGPDGGPGLG